LVQVCSLAWSENQRELASAHGYTRNEISLWRFPSMAKQAELVAHMDRTLEISISPDGNTLVKAQNLGT